METKLRQEAGGEKYLYDSGTEKVRMTRGKDHSGKYKCVQKWYESSKARVVNLIPEMQQKRTGKD